MLYPPMDVGGQAGWRLTKDKLMKPLSQRLSRPGDGLDGQDESWLMPHF